VEYRDCSNHQTLLSRVDTPINPFFLSDVEA